MNSAHLPVATLPRPQLPGGLSPAKWPGLAASLCAALLVAACGGGGTTTDAMTPSALAPASASGLRAFPNAFLTRKSVAYSPFRTSNRDTETVTDTMVKEDLDLLVQAGIGLIRIFDSSDKTAARTLKVIKDNNLDIKVMLGVYVNSFEYEKDAIKRKSAQIANEDEMARGVTLAKAYRDQVVAVSIGNETMVSWSFVPISTPVMAGYIKTVRDQITQPVTTDDNWAFYAGINPRNGVESPSDVLRQIDFASIHTYSIEDVEFSNFADSDPAPDWDWQQTGVTDLTKRASAMMDAALAKTKSDYAAARAYLDKNGRSAMPIIIGETGWKAADPSGRARYKFLGHPANQKMYYARLLDWAVASRRDNGPKGVVYFEAFDEPWKGSDDKWGLFGVDRKARCAAQMLNAAATWTKDTSSSCDESAALYYKPPTLNAAETSNLVIHSEAVTGWPAGMRADAYQGGTFTLNYPATGDSATGDLAGGGLGASHYISLNTFNNSAGYGWGLLWQSAAATPVSANMSNFASGSVRFSVRTTYAGQLLIGVASDTMDGKGAEALVKVSNGSYGYCNTGVWCDVSIPLSAFQAANPSLDLRFILTRISISDIWDKTGNTARSGQPEIRLDNMYWAR